jgi:hypothetical protein
MRTSVKDAKATGIAKAKVWLFSVLALMPWFACAFVVPKSTVIWLLLGGLINGVVLYRFALALIKPRFPSQTLATPIIVSEIQREHSDALSRALHERGCAEQAQIVAMEHLESGLLRLSESRQEAELAVLKAGESVKRLGALQKAQMHWIQTHAVSRISRSGTMPHALRVINQQVETEVQRLVVQLQFQDVFDQKLNKVAGADIGAALLTLSKANEQATAAAVSVRKKSSNAANGITQRSLVSVAVTGITVTPVKRGEIEFF